MKKFKLITPVIGLTTVTGLIVPLASCNKNDFGNVTQQQWQSSWDEIWDISKDRNFTADIDIDVSGEFGNTHIDIVNKSKAQQDDIYYHEEDNNEYEKTAQIYFAQYQNDNWMILGDYNKQTAEWDYTCNPLSKSLLSELIGGQIDFVNWRTLYQLFGIFYGWYNATSYDSNTNTYNCNFLDTDPIYLHFGFAFDNLTKKLNKFDVNFKLTFPDGKTGSVDLTAKLEFGSTQDITIPNDALDVIKASTVECELNSESVTTEPKDWDDNINMVYNLKPQTSATQEFKYNKITVNGCELDKLSILINSVPLIKNIDYKFENCVDHAIITFYSEFSNKNDVKFLLNPHSDKEDVTITISNDSSI